MLDPDPIGPEEYALALLVAFFAMLLMSSYWIGIL
jgi:hypothetical protein